MAKKLYTALGYASSIVFWISAALALLIFFAVLFFFENETALSFLRTALASDITIAAFSVWGMIFADKKLS